MKHQPLFVLIWMVLWMTSTQATPNPPTDISVTLTTSTSHYLSWTAPFGNHSTVTSYQVEQKNSYNDKWIEAITEPDIVVSSECKIIDLLPFNDYSYRVYAVNNIGIGEPSDTSTMFQTSKGAPVKKVRRFRGGPGNLGELVLVWEPLSEEYYGSDEVTYVVAIHKRLPGDSVRIPLPLPSDEEDWNEARISDAKRGNFTFAVGDDEVYTPYLIRIRADNDMGKGPWGLAMIAYTLELRPDVAPTALRTKNIPEAYLAQLEWDRLYSPNGEVTSYKVKIEPVEPADPITAPIVSYRGLWRGIPGVIVKKLTSNTVYNAFVAAITRAGQGPYSDPLVFTTSKKPPSKPPRSLKLSVKNAIISASWEPIVYEEGEGMDEATLIGYKVQYCLEAQYSSYINPLRFAKTLTTSRNITHLNFPVANNSRFAVLVRGYSAGGDGRPVVLFVSTQKSQQGWKRPLKRWELH